MDSQVIDPLKSWKNKRLLYYSRSSTRSSIMATHAPLILLTILSIPTSMAHMGMTLTPAGGTRLYPRSKAKVNDNYRIPNHPAMGHTCHGVAKGSSVVTLTPGETITGTTSYGAGHGGGQCAWMISTDEKTWYKVSETR